MNLRSAILLLVSLSTPRPRLLRLLLFLWLLLDHFLDNFLDNHFGFLRLGLQELARLGLLVASWIGHLELDLGELDADTSPNSLFGWLLLR